jgi:DamX protein
LSQADAWEDPIMTRPTNDPSTPQDPNEALRVISARLSVLEDRLDGRFKPSEGGGDSERPVERAELYDELRQLRDQLRDYEKALVERIADVDDERRATTSRLQRAWQAQREEIDGRLRLHAGLLGGLLALFAIIFIVALVFVYHESRSGQPKVATEVSEIRAKSAQISGGGGGDKEVRERLKHLTTELGAITSALGRLDQKGNQTEKSSAVERTARQRAEDRLAEEIRNLGEKQRRLTKELTSLRSTLRAVEAAGGREELPVADVVPGATASAAPPAGEVTPGPERELVEEALPEPASAPAGTVEGSQEQASEGDASTTEQTDTASPDPQDTLVAGGDIFALQLIGFFNRKALEDFVAEKVLPERVYVMRQTYKGRPWYELIYGLYDDRAAAEKAVSQLPEDLTALEPWIRPLSEVTELQILETGHKSEKEFEQNR